MVKEMKMPKSCATCCFSDWRGGDTANCRIIETTPQGNLLCRPDWCPLGGPFADDAFLNVPAIIESEE